MRWVIIFLWAVGNVPIVGGLCLVGFSMWDLHHREWLLSSLVEARAAPSRQHTNLYLSAGLTVYINCDLEIQTSFSLHAVPGHKKSYFHYSPKINSNLESGEGRWPSSLLFVTKLNAQVTQTLQYFWWLWHFYGARCARESLSLRFPAAVCLSPDVYYACLCSLGRRGEWGFVTSLCGAGTKHSRRKRKKTLGSMAGWLAAACIAHQHSRPNYYD